MGRVKRPLAAAGAAVLFVTLGVVVGGPIRAAFGSPGANSGCGPRDFVNMTNLASNPEFQTVGPNGPSVHWQNGDPTPPPSAAADWLMHSDNAGDPVASKLIASTAPGHTSGRMLRFTAHGVESGIYQAFPGAPATVMFSVWVKALSGRVAMQAQGGVGGPTSWTVKTGEWEQLRVCTDGTVPVDTLIIYNQAAGGGVFYADGVEVYEFTPGSP